MNAIETYYVENEKDGEAFELNIEKKRQSERREVFELKLEKKKWSTLLLSLTPATTRTKEKMLCTLGKHPRHYKAD